MSLPHSRRLALIDERGDSQSDGVLRLQANRDGTVFVKGIAASGVLAIRDKLGLITLDALCISREWILFVRVEPCEYEVVDQRTDAQDSLMIFDALRLSITGRMRWGHARVENPIKLYNGKLKEGGYLEPGEPRDGPENLNARYARRFARAMYYQRDAFRKWENVPFSEAGGVPFVLHRIEGYELVMSFQNRTVSTPDGLRVELRDATTLQAKEVD